MIVKTFNIPIYDTKVTLCQITSQSDFPKVKKLIKVLNVESELLKDIQENIENANLDGGVTLTDMSIRRVIVLFYNMSSHLTQEKVYSHEKRHIEDRILNWVNVDDIESAGLLAGWLAKQFFKFKEQVLKYEITK